MSDELIVACPPPRLKEKRLANGTYRYTEGELEKRCSRCRDYWPADNEFFYACSAEPDGLNCYCKACYVERRWPEGRSTTTTQKGSNP